MPLTQSEITNLQNDGVFKDDQRMARLNNDTNIYIQRDGRLLNITYDDIKNETVRQMNMAGYTKLN